MKAKKRYRLIALILTICMVASILISFTGCGSKVNNSGADSNYSLIHEVNGVEYCVPNGVSMNATAITNISDDMNLERDQMYLYKDGGISYFLFSIDSLVIAVQKGTSFDLDQAEDMLAAVTDNDLMGIWFSSPRKKLDYDRSGNKTVCTVKAEVAVTESLYNDFVGKLAVISDGTTEWSLFAGVIGEKYDKVDKEQREVVEYIAGSFKESDYVYEEEEPAVVIGSGDDIEFDTELPDAEEIPQEGPVTDLTMEQLSDSIPKEFLLEGETDGLTIKIMQAMKDTYFAIEKGEDIFESYDTPDMQYLRYKTGEEDNAYKCERDPENDTSFTEASVNLFSTTDEITDITVSEDNAYDVYEVTDKGETAEDDEVFHVYVNRDTHKAEYIETKDVTHITQNTIKYYFTAITEIPTPSWTEKAREIGTEEYMTDWMDAIDGITEPEEQAEDPENGSEEATGEATEEEPGEPSVEEQEVEVIEVEEEQGEEEKPEEKPEEKTEEEKEPDKKPESEEPSQEEPAEESEVNPVLEAIEEAKRASEEEKKKREAEIREVQKKRGDMIRLNNQKKQEHRNDNTVYQSDIYNMLDVGLMGETHCFQADTGEYETVIVRLLDVYIGTEAEKMIKDAINEKKVDHRYFLPDEGCSWHVARYTVDTSKVSGETDIYVDVRLRGVDGRDLRFRGVKYGHRSYDIKLSDDEYLSFYAVPNGCPEYALEMGDGTIDNDIKSAYYHVKDYAWWASN